MANRRRERAGVAAIVVALAVLGAPACGSEDGLALCGTIPAGGCPIGRGGTCDDPTCTGVYDCSGGTWRVAERCSPRVGGDAGAPRDGGAPDAACGSVSIDTTGEAIGCKPDLELPDCPVAAAEQCARAACLTGCTDFFLCTADGYRAVAYCDDSGALVASKR